jgi:Helix-turn-helix domain
MTVITMSRKELARLRVLIDVADGRLSVADATGLIGVGRRQVYRLLDGFRASGPDGLISRKRGRSSNRVGPMPRTSGYYIAITHSGVTLSPFLGAAVADEVVHGRQRAELADFRPARFFN